MLVLSRQRDETIMIGDDIEITVVDIRGDKVRLGINAPTRIAVHRKEVYDAIKKENEDAAITTNNHPEPKGLKNDPKLLSEIDRVYWSGNNYFTAHMRNIALMSLALDEGDDPGGALKGHLDSAVGSWLLMSFSSGIVMP